MNYDRYATRKTIGQGLVNAALLVANCSSLKQLLDSEDYPYRTVGLVLIGISLALQVCPTMSNVTFFSDAHF